MTKIEIRNLINKVMADVKVTDIHTHLYGPEFGKLMSWGIDELLTHHYLVAEALRWRPVSAVEFLKLDKKSQADIVWKTLFIDHSPISAPAVGLLDILNGLGLDTASRDIEAYRRFFAGMTPETAVERTLTAAGLDCVVMTNDPLDDEERAVWETNPKRHPKFHTAIRLDTLFNNWDENYSRLAEWGYQAEKEITAKTIEEVNRFLDDWIQRIKPLYVAMSLPPTFTYPADNKLCKLIDNCVLPTCRDKNLALAMMIGVKRLTNPEMGMAGDSVGRADILTLESICRTNPNNKFLLTMLSRENQFELTVAARKFPNLMIFGTWWFLHIPSMIDEITRMRFELLGTSFIPQHSDVRVLEQTIGKWAQSRKIVGDILADRYFEAVNAGWQISEADVRRDVELLFGGNFWNFIGRK